MTHTAYLCTIVQQQLHAVSISNHACTVQRFQCPMHPVHISSLGPGGMRILTKSGWEKLNGIRCPQDNERKPTLRIRSSTLSWGNERMAAMVRMSRSDKEYLLWMLCIMYHIVELMCNWGPWHPGRGVARPHWKKQPIHQISILFYFFKGATTLQY